MVQRKLEVGISPVRLYLLTGFFGATILIHKFDFESSSKTKHKKQPPETTQC